MPIEPIKTYTPPTVSPIETEKGKKAKTPVPPPPQPPEFFPGFRTEVSTLTQDIYQANKRATDAYKKLSQVRSGYNASDVLSSLFPPAKIIPLIGHLNDEQEEQRAKDELDIATRELQNSEWQLQVMNTLPSLLSSRRFSITGIDDVLKQIPNLVASDTERQWLQSTFDRLKYLTNTLPEDFSGTLEESQAKILEYILAEPKRGLRAVHNLTIDELEKSLQPFAIDMPKGMTAEDIRSVMGKVNLEDEALQKELHAHILELANTWAKETDRLNLLRAGLLQEDSPSLTPAEFAKMTLVQPMMAGIELLNKYFDMLPRPLATSAIIGVHQLFQTPEDTLAGRMHQSYQYFRSMGESSWDAYALAINETDMPWYMRMGVESAFDPTTYIGIGVGPAMASKAGSMLTRVGFRGVGSRVGPLAAAIENGYVRGTDALFKAGVEVVVSPLKGSFWLAGAGYQIPRTLTMMSRNFARHTSLNFKSVVERLHPDVKGMSGMTALDIRNAAQASIDAALTRPGEGLDLMVKTGSQLLEFEYIDAEQAAKILKDVVAEGTEFDTVRLARINDEVSNMLSGQSTLATSGKIISAMNMSAYADEAMVRSLATRLASVKDDIVSNAMKMFKSENPSEQLIGMFEKLEEVRYSNLTNPITDHMTQSGQTISWLQRMSDRVLYSTNLVNFERKVIMPFARWNLLFANFGPMNFFENMQRSFLGGAEVMYPKSYSGVAETNRLFRGLSNAPYELQMAERGAQRMEMALVDPKTGSTSAFRNGKIPFVTREVTVGGRTLGKTINIRGVDYKLTDFQSYNDMWEQMTTIQRAYDYQVHYMKSLPEVAPEEMNMIVGAIEARHNELSSISKLSPADVKDIERTVLQDATVGPEAVAAHSGIDALELERRQISKMLGKEFDKATDVRVNTKLGIRNEVLDGSIFKDIPGRRAAWKEADRELDLASLAAQSNALEKEADDFANIYGGKASLLEQLDQDVRLVPSTSNIDIQANSDITLDGEKVGSITASLVGGPGSGTNIPVKTLYVGELNITTPGLLNKRLARNIELALHEQARLGGAERVVISAKDSHKVMYTSAGYKPLREDAEDLAGNYFTKDTMQPPSAPQNLDELLGDLENISSIQNGVDERIHDYRRLAELRSQKLKPGKEVDDFHVGTNRLLGEFMERSQKSMDSIVENLKSFLARRQGVKLSDSQVKAVDSLANLYRMENANVLATRNKLAEVESKITKTPPRNRDARFWQQQRAEKAAIWDEHTINSRKLRNLRLDASRVFLNSVKKGAFVPNTIPPVVGELTPSHIAYLFGASGDDVYRGLTRVHNQVTIRPKEDFVDYVRSQANAYAMKFDKAAADIGFTDQAIGDVYDQLWRNLGIEPSALTPDSPSQMQLDSIFNELERLHASVKMDETDSAKWNQYIQGITSDLKQMPMYKPSGEMESPIDALIADADNLIARAAGKQSESLTVFKNALNIAKTSTGKLRTDALTTMESYEPAVRQMLGIREGETIRVISNDDWIAKKEAAMTRAREKHSLAYPTYDDSNIIDESMRSIFPFWTYELFRWRWIPRTMMRTPGTATGLARYMDYTDGGYVPVPGTDLQLNPLRGSIWMGGMRRLFLKDFPEYYDAFPGMEFIDYISRAGFYPGAHVMAPIVALGQLSGKPEYSEIAPTWIKTGLSALRAASPEHIGKVLDIVYPDRFRDFQTMLTLGEQGYDADEIWRKRTGGQKLTPEEEKLWLRAEAKANGLKGILMEQTGVFRLRPAEYDSLKTEMRLAIQDITGVSVNEQERIDRLYPTTGKRFSDYYKLDVLQQKLLYESESYRRWQGVATPLYPSGWQQLEISIRDYYETLEKNSTEARRVGVYRDGKLIRPSMVEVNRQRVEGTIGPDQWSSMREEIQGSMSESARVLGESPAYKDVPKTLEERAAWLEEKGVPTPTYGADQELLWYYYELEPELTYNWESDRMELDFDSYYAQVDILLESLDEAHRQRLLDRIQVDWTPMERLYWTVSREYFRPYRNIRSVVMEKYSPEEQQLIRRYEVARGAEREKIQDIQGPEGQKLIAGFNAQIKEARQRLRYLDPTLDAWSYFFGKTDSFITSAAEEQYKQLESQYLNESMVE